MPGTPPGGMPGMPGTPPGGVPQGTPPGGLPGQQQTPFPPAFKWSTQPPTAQPNVPPESSSESTQTIRPVSAPPSGEATQVVRGAPGPDRTQALNGRPGDPDRTQVVPNPSYGAPRPGQPGQQWQDPANNLYSSGQMDSMPNWNAGGAFGDWPKQGPEVFESAGGGKRGRRIALIALIVVVLAGAGVGAWLLIGNQNNNAHAQGGGTTTRTTPATTTSQGPRRAIDSLVSPPGGYAAPESFTPAQLASTKPLPTPDLDILAQTSLSKADYVLNRDGNTVLDLWSFTVPDETAAKQLAKAFDTDQGRFGYQKTDITVGDGQYVAYTSQQQSNGQNIIVYRLHYVVGNQVIRVEAFDQDGTRARSEFVKLLQEQTKLTPPSTN